MLFVKVFNSLPKLLWIPWIQVFEVVGFSSAKQTGDLIACRPEFSTITSLLEQVVSSPHCLFDGFAQPRKVPL